LDYLSGEIDLRRAQERIAIATAQYAKRQMTWFRREKGVEWFEGCGDEPLVVETVLRYLHEHVRHPSQETLHAETAS
jgi:tRNA A37 N6-isopentenylltransferase MiaA